MPLHVSPSAADLITRLLQALLPYHPALCSSRLAFICLSSPCQNSCSTVQSWFAFKDLTPLAATNSYLVY